MITAAEDAPATATTDHAADPMLSARILLVDDKQPNVLLLERLLRNAGYVNLTSTRDPRAVCALHAAHRYDLILLDLQMPGMDGFAVLEGLKQVEQDGYLPVLVITAQPGHKLHALKAGAKDFVSKPFDVAEVLTRVRNMLEVRLLHVELRRKNAELKVLFDQVVAERKRSERLALQLAPGSIAVRLPTRPDATDETVADVTVLIADLVGFAEVIPSLDHAVMTSCLEELFAGFDALTTARGVRTVKVLGNSYMAAAGVPFAMSDHAVQAALLARDMMEALEQFNERTGCTLQLRIGLASGTAFAAVLGKRRFLYDLWGGAVAIAERMESHGVAGRVQLSQGTRELLDESVDVEPRGMLEVEGLGEVQTWFLR